MASHATGSSSNGRDAEDHLPTAELTRPSPDAILADEADPDTLLGLESDSDAGSNSRPVSMSAARRASRRISRRMLDVPLDDNEGGETGNASRNDAEPTPTRSQFSSQAMQQQHTVTSAKPAATEEELRAQVTELTAQVTSLNNKLVTSFMRLGDLEDDLSEAQENYTASRAHIATLEKEREQHLAALNTGLLVEKEHVSTEMQKMMERLVQETAEKGKAVSDKQKIESELDELSSSLFSEANKMVAVERLARARADEKSQSMEERLKDTEEIVGQQQKRLVELQALVERHEQQQTAAQEKQKQEDTPANADNTGTGLLAIPSKVTSSALMLSQYGREANKSYLRLDIVPYVELRMFLNHLRRLRLQLSPFYTYPVAPATDETIPTSGTPIGSRAASPNPNQSAGHPSSLSIVPSLSGVASASPFLAAGVTRHKDFPTLPANVEQLIHLPSQVSSLSFLKRLNEEDCEPCLRLDIAPGLNWLSRRQMQGAILDGTLMIEPIFGGGIYDEDEVRAKAIGAPPAACAMCGKAVVNVPLPGGANATDSSTWLNAASSLQAGVNAISGSLPGREMSSSPPPTSNTLNATAGASTQRDATKSKSSSIFSTLRNISGGNSSSLRAATSSPTSDNVLAQQQAQAQLQSVGVVEDLFSRRPPAIPTHIFRISESSSARYLLCPDFCLRRVRATCDFWGYIRNLERAVVLEGKYAWDEEEQPAADAPRVPTKDEQLSKDALRGDAMGENPAEEPVEDVTGGSGSAGDDKDDKEKKRQSTPHKPMQTDRKASLTATGSDAGSDFADARSQHSSDEDDEPASEEVDDENSKAKKTEEEGREAEEDGDGDNNADAKDASDTDKANGAPASLEKGSDEGEAGSSLSPIQQLTDEDRPTASNAGPPPPPPRLPRTVRPVPKLPDALSRSSTPTTPPALPPRRDRPTPALPLSPGAVSLGPEPKRLLTLHAAERSSTSWEEKVWREVNQLRAELWVARVGMEAADD